MVIAIRHVVGAGIDVPTRYYRASVSSAWMKRHDNGTSVSCSLTVGGSLTEYDLQVLINRGETVEISEDEWNHSGCKSECIRRGGQECRW